MNPMKSAFIFFFFFITALSFNSCKSDGSKSGNEDINLDEYITDDAIFDDINKAKKIFYSLPSPLETAMLIKTAGATYNEELLNPLANADKYSTNRALALNLGTYTTDLSFASLFDQTQASIDYMQASKKMADGLGILDAIDNTTIERLEANVNNREVIMDIISETFMNSSSFLQEDNRPAVAAIVLVGGWIEGLYIATQLVGDKPIEGNKLAERILEQKLSFDIVQRLLEDNKYNEDVVALIEELEPLKQAFDKVEIKSTPVTAEETKGEAVTTLKAKSEIIASEETFEELQQVVKELRTKFIS
jgi:hypothetical protein